MKLDTTVKLEFIRSGASALEDQAEQLEALRKKMTPEEIQSYKNPEPSN